MIRSVDDGVGGTGRPFWRRGGCRRNQRRGECAECPSIPTAALWGEIDHGKASRYVANKHDGDCPPM